MRLLGVAARILRRAYLEYRLLCWEINRRLRQSVTVSTKQGVLTVYLAAHESIGRDLYCKREHGLETMSKSMAFLRSIRKCPPKGEGTVIDIGANNGVISIGMLYTGELERAIAVEPEPRNFSLLQHNVKQNELEDRVICLPYAVSHRKGEIQFELSDTNFGDHRIRLSSGVVGSAELFHESERRAITVETDQLDDLLAHLPETFTKKIAVIWVDVQGCEGYVFMGAETVLSKGIPVVSEIWPYGIQRAGMSPEQFCDIAEGIWSSYWVMRRGRFVRYPIRVLDTLFDELGYDGGFDNAVFTQ